MRPSSRLLSSAFALAVATGCLPADADVASKLMAGSPGLRDIVFAVRKPGHDDHWYANFGYYGPDENRAAYLPGGRLCIARPRHRRGHHPHRRPARRTSATPSSTTMPPAFSSHGARAPSPHYHLHTCQLDGSDIRQLTDGPWDDIEPCILPDGDIVFVSSRCKRWVNCWLTQVATLHRCKADGTGIHPDFRQHRT